MPLECIVPNRLWHAQQPLKFGPIAISTRMTVVRLRDESLWVNSPIAPTPDLVEQLRGIGQVRFVIAPNKSHHRFFVDFLAAYPLAQGFIAPGLEKKRADLAHYPQLSGGGLWNPELRSFFIEGLPIINETVWFHEDTGTLIVTDLLFCFSEANRGLASLVARALGVRGNLAMSRTMKLLTADKVALARTVKPLQSLPVRRVIVAHDAIISEAPATKLVQAFAWLQ